MATPKNFINSVVYAKPGFSQADGLPRFYPTIDLQGGNIDNVVLINGELPITVPPTGGYVRYDACDGTIYDISVNLMNGVSNIQLGYQAGDYGKGSRNVMIGYFAANGTGTDLSDSVVIGTQAGVNSDGSNNVYIGPYTGYYTGGSNNVFIGSNTGYDMSGINNNNIFLGRNAGSFLRDISDTIIIGDASDVLIRGHMKNHTLDICGNLNISNSINSYQYFKNGTVGINNNNPDDDYSLDVSGSSIIRGNLDICGNFYISGNIIYDGSGVNIDVSNGGMILLGTGSAQATLQVRDGGVTINSDGTQGAYMTIGYANDYTIRDPNHMIDCSGSIITHGNIDICDGSLSLYDNNSTAGNNYTFSKGINLKARYLSSNSSLYQYGTIVPYRAVDGTANTTAIKINNMYVNNNSQVSIGKPPSSYILDVSGSANIVGDLNLDTGGVRYTHISLDGGNSKGYLYGAYNANLGGGILGDGIHLGYNFLGADDINPNSIPSTGCATSRLSLGYGSIGAYTGGVNTPPSNLGYYQDSSGNVGIGTTTPIDTLDVSGSIHMSGTNGSAASRITTTGGVMYLQSMLTNGNIGGFQFTNVDVSGSQVAAYIDGSGNATFYNSLKANITSPFSRIGAPYYSFKYTSFNSVTTNNPNFTAINFTQDGIYADSGGAINSVLGTANGLIIPVTGIYMIGWNVWLEAGQNTIAIRAESVGNYFPNSYGKWVPITSTNNRLTDSFTTIAYLSAGNQLVFKATNDANDSSASIVQELTVWGYLLHSV